VPAKSKKQQRFMGMVRAVQKGEAAPTSDDVRRAAMTMEPNDVKDFARTKHKGLPMRASKKRSREKKADFSKVAAAIANIVLLKRAGLIKLPARKANDSK